MTFRPGARLDPSQVEDARGRGGFGGLAAWMVVRRRRARDRSSPLVSRGAPGRQPSTGDDVGGLGGQTIGGGTGDPAASTALATSARPGPTRTPREDCRIVGYVNSVQAYWTAEFAASGQQYARPGRRSSAARSAPAAAPPRRTSAVLLPDRPVRLHRPRVLRRAPARRSGRTGGPLAQGYVIAHEYGHHVQDLLGTLPGVPGQQGADGQSVRTELQADCYAGVWAGNAVRRPATSSRLTDAEIADALMPPRPSATTGSSSRAGASTRRPGPTARPPSASMVHGRLQLGRRGVRHVQRADLIGDGPVAAAAWPGRGGHENARFRIGTGRRLPRETLRRP